MPQPQSLYLSPLFRSQFQITSQFDGYSNVVTSHRDKWSHRTRVVLVEFPWGLNWEYILRNKLNNTPPTPALSQIHWHCSSFIFFIMMFLHVINIRGRIIMGFFPTVECSRPRKVNFVKGWKYNMYNEQLLLLAVVHLIFFIRLLRECKIPGQLNSLFTHVASYWYSCWQTYLSVSFLCTRFPQYF